MKRLLIDVSSICWAGLYAGKDEEFAVQVEHNDRIVNVNSWKHGIENVLNSVISAWTKNGIQPKDTILVYEEGDSKGKRSRILPTYKQGRDDNRPEEYYTQFNLLRDNFMKMLQQVGATTVTRPGLEADDVLAYLAEKLQGEIVIQTNDRDMAALLNERVSLWRENELVTTNPYGPWPVEWMAVYKALVGDASDKIPGAKGFGNAAWMNLISIFGADAIPVIEGLIQTQTLGELAENVADLKTIQRIIDNADDVYKSYAVGKLYPEDCENMRRPMVWGPSYVHARSEIEDDRLRGWGGVNRIVDTENYDQARQFLVEKLAESEYVSLDLETSTSDESDDWIEKIGGGVDVLDSKITSMGLTFGANQQYNLYFTVEHDDSQGNPNITLEQLRVVLESIPVEIPKVIANFSGFEAIVLRNAFGDLNGHYFLPNVIDVQLEARYVNENVGFSLSNLTKHFIGYEMLEYKDVTQGRKMRELTAQEAFAYGTGDTIFTSALHNHFRAIMEIEDTLEGFNEVELDAQYLFAYGLLHGIGFNPEALNKIEAEDQAESEEAQKIMDRFLIEKGYVGAFAPVYTLEDLEVAAQIKDMYLRVTGEPLATRVRTPSKLIELIDSEDCTDSQLLAKFMRDKDMAQINDWVASRFEPEPMLNLGSPKQVQNFLYNICKLPVWLANPLTQNERDNKEDLSAAMYKFNRIQRGSEDAEPLTEDERLLVAQKATTDEKALEFALKYDILEGNPLRPVLKAFQTLKTNATRQSLYYTPYRNLVYWQDGKMHPSIRQSATTTLRVTASRPNVTQLAREGEGVKVRSCYVPHRKNAIIASLDINAQELRAQADLSEDPVFLACYIGDNKKDLHSVTGAAIMGVDYDEFMAGRFNPDPKVAQPYKSMRDDTGKPVNFLSSYSGSEVALSKEMIVPQPEAKVFLDAKRQTFARYEEYQQEVQDMAKSKGYVVGPTGSRRHVDHVMRDGTKWEIAAAARSAGNYPIQNGSAAQIKIAMGAIWRSGIMLTHDVHFYMPVHDELVFSVVVEDAVEVIQTAHYHITAPFLKQVPTVSSVSIGLDYANLTEVAECGQGELTDEQILGKVNKLQGQPELQH